MNSKIYIKYLTLTASLVLLVLSARMTAELFTGGINNINSGIDTALEDSLSVFTNDTVKRAAGLDLSYDDRDISWEGGSPFMPEGGRINRIKQRKPVIRFEREELVLNGTLLKDDPLALLEDKRGKTYIRGRGGEVLGRKVIKITEDSVIIRDPAGSEVLYVSGKK